MPGRLPKIGARKMANKAASRLARPLRGENLKTTHWEDARHWMSIYADLLEFKRGILERIRRDVAKLMPPAQKAAMADLEIIETQMKGYEMRLDLWYRRVWELHGLWLDPAGRLIRYRGRELSLTKREFQLLQFLLDHPHRYFTTAQILGQAWADPALFPEEVRNYIRRLRTVLTDFGVPADLVNKPGRGYSLVFRDEGVAPPSRGASTREAL
jgi:DNA-binding winged helix-turn-helix (wHTH) protein